MIFMVHWTQCCLPLVVGSLLSSSLAFAHKNMANQEKDIHAHQQAESQEIPQVREVKIVIRDGAYYLFHGDRSQSNSLFIMAGEDVRLSIQNEDPIAHEMISPLFMRADIRIEGKGIGLFRREAGGFRLSPGDHLSTQFTVPFFEFESFYDLIWCARHGNRVGNGKELLVVKTQSGSIQP